MNGTKIYKKRLLNLLQPIEYLDIITWAEKYIDTIPDSPFSGKLNLHRTPFLIEPLRVTAREDVSLSVMNFPVQIGKSLILKLLALYQIKNDPSPILFLTDTADNSQDFCDTSLVPMLRQNKVFDGLISSAHGSNMKETKIFNNGAILWNRGASNLKNLQRRSVKLLLADECWLFPDGHIEEAIKRITRFQNEGGKAVLVSQAGDAGAEFDTYFNQTTQHEFMWKCNECGNHNAYNMEMLKYDENLIDENGDYNATDVKASLSYVCPFCGKEYPCNDKTLSTMNERSIWVQQNENAEINKVGFHTTALCFLDAYTILSEYLTAKKSAKDGDFNKMRMFYQKRLALPWNETYEIVDTATKEVETHNFGEMWQDLTYITKSGEFINESHTEFKREVLNGALPLIFMAVDVQQDHFYYSIRAFSSDPQNKSMLLECGRLYTWQDVFAKRAEYKIPNSNVGIDSGYRTKEVYSITVENRCFAMKGHTQRSFKREVPNVLGRKIYESHAVAEPQTIQIQTVETNLNGKRTPKMRKALLLSFSANAAKDWIHYNRQKTQKGRANYDIPQNTPSEYNEHMNAEKRVAEGRHYVWRPRKSKIPNHFLDTETMIYALLLNLLLTRGNNTIEEYLN